MLRLHFVHDLLTYKCRGVVPVATAILVLDTVQLQGAISNHASPVEVLWCLLLHQVLPIPEDVNDQWRATIYPRPLHCRDMRGVDECGEVTWQDDVFASKCKYLVMCFTLQWFTWKH